MDKAASSRNVSKWADLHRDILAMIFHKLDVRDIAMGASRVCISWFLASHNKTLWNTLDLAKVQQVEEGLSLRIIMKKIIKFFDINETRQNLRYITKLSQGAPKNLFFNLDAYIQEDDLVFVAERMPNIEKLVLPRWCFQSKKSYQFAFSQWRNLKTLIIAHDNLTGNFVFQEVGMNCNNLTNLKYFGDLRKNTAKLIVSYLQSLRRLSLQCSFVRNDEVLLLITGLKNLRILNFSHCKELGGERIPNQEEITIGNLKQAAIQNYVILLLCPKDNCRVCKAQPKFCMFWSYGSKIWRNDEIKELEF
ncbi:unnamed protein product [Microthlaspi erraticum]|uniref:F-box domain-containing protein n=1 Tax=Microthlaspi erraticum TaxID=1685480 RepID=A0A6D2HR35_9BRAS|nr:unnamed protein product [Microthlaspi erraticum]